MIRALSYEMPGDFYIYDHPRKRHSKFTKIIILYTTQD